MKLFDLKNAGHWPTLLAAFLYFDFSFMVWTVLGPPGAQIGEKLNLSPGQKGLMVALPILAGAVLRILLGLLVDRVGAKNAGIMAQLVVITGLALAWILGLPNYPETPVNGLRAGFRRCKCYVVRNLETGERDPSRESLLLVQFFFALKEEIIAL